MSAPTPEDKFGFDDNDARPALYDYENERRALIESFSHDSSRKFTHKIRDSLYGVDTDEALWLGISALGAITIVGALDYQDELRSLTQQSFEYVRERVSSLFSLRLPR